MTAALIFSCLVWTNTTLTQIIDQPINEYGVAEIRAETPDFKFFANVFEERVNYVEITHIKTSAQAMAYTIQWPQDTLITKLRIGELDSSLDCSIKYPVQP
jgi:hypothetical protein